MQVQLAQEQLTFDLKITSSILPPSTVLELLMLYTAHSMEAWHTSTNTENHGARSHLAFVVDSHVFWGHHGHSA